MQTRELDDLDRYVIYRLQGDARTTSAAEIADDYGVSPSTVRNRISQLVEDGVVEGAHLDVNYELAGYPLYTLIFCTAPVPERDELAKEALDVPGVVSVRELMTGEENLHVIAVGRDSDDLNRISRELSSIGLEIAEEELVHSEHTRPYDGFDVGELDDG